jgi:hypothetical protein
MKAESSQVQKKHKRLPYTVTVLGGKKELEDWRAQRDAFDEEWYNYKEAKTRALKAAAQKLVELQEGRKLTYEERKEIEFFNSYNILISLIKSEKTTKDSPKFIFLSQKPLTFCDKIKSWFWQTLQNAFPK